MLKLLRQSKHLGSVWRDLLDIVYLRFLRKKIGTFRFCLKYGKHKTLYLNAYVDLNIWPLLVFVILAVLCAVRAEVQETAFRRNTAKSLVASSCLYVRMKQLGCH